MSKILKVLGLVLVALVAVGAVFVLTFSAKARPATTEAIERTPARVQRGKYLVDGVLGCMDCHAQRDFTRFGGPVVGPPGAGQDCYGPEFKMPGTVCVPNITPDPETGIGAWSDDEILRSIREGVDRDGNALFMMPYTQYRALSDEDARSVVAYLRELPAVKRQLPPTQIKFPVSFFIKMGPKPLEGPVPEPARDNPVAYGQYLAKVGVCQFCHTPIDKKHLPIPGQEFAGGHEFYGPWGALRSSNLTPHATGMGDRDEKAFVGMFKAFAGPESDLPVVTPEKNTVMPWLSRARMTEADLGAIHAYLKTVPVRDNAVEKRPPPAMPAPTGDAGKTGP
jgi:hypothetical protein